MSYYPADIVRIPIENIVIDKKVKPSTLNVLSLAAKYSANNETINYLPITAVGVDGGMYKILQGHNVYYSLKESGAEWVNILRLRSEGIDPPIWMYELGELDLKLNICTLKNEDIEVVFDWLQSNIKQLARINVEKLTSKLISDPFRRFWSSLDILAGFKCGLTKASLKTLSKFIEALPDFSGLEPIVPLQINTASEEAIENQFLRLAIEPGKAKLNSIDALTIARKIVSEQDRIYWADGKDLKKAKVGITQATWSLMDDAFSFLPAPAPYPNTSRYLLSKMRLTQLRKEAEDRGIETKGLKKDQIISKLV